MLTRTIWGVKLLVCSLFLAAPLLRAQEPQLFLIDQRNFGKQGPATSTETQPVEEQYRDELGPLHPLLRLRYNPFQVYSDTSYLYDSNILLTDDKPVNDMVLSQVFGASYAPRIFPDLKTVFYARHYIDRYDQNDSFDFDGDEGGVDVAYTLVKPPIPYREDQPSSTWTLYGDGSVQRLTSTPDSAEIFKMADVRLGLRCDFTAPATSTSSASKHIAPFYGVQLDWRPSSPSILTRVDGTLFLGANVDLLKNLYVQFLGRVQCQHYLDDSRDDFTETVSLSLIYRINAYASIGASGLFANNNTNVRALDYRVVSGGPSLTLQVRF